MIENVYEGVYTKEDKIDFFQTMATDVHVHRS